MSEVTFVIEEAPEGGYLARAVGVSIFTEADSLDDLRAAIRDAVACHYPEDDRPKVVRLHFVRDEVMSV